MDTLPGQPAAPHEPPRGCWSRHWKWIVPTGCLTIVLLVAAFAFAMVTLLFGAMKSSDVYKTALSAAQNNAEVMEALGTPIKDGWIFSGKISTEGPAGEASLAIPISGPKNKGTIYVEARKAAGRWNFNTLEVEVKGAPSRINLAPTTTLDVEAEDDNSE
jgi:hypothetical protein